MIDYKLPNPVVERPQQQDSPELVFVAVHSDYSEPLEEVVDEGLMHAIEVYDS